MTTSSTAPALGEVLISKGLTLVLIDGCQPVRLNHVITIEGRAMTVIGATAPVYDGAPGRVYLKGVEFCRKLEVRPNEIGMAWRARP